MRFSERFRHSFPGFGSCFYKKGPNFVVFWWNCCFEHFFDPQSGSILRPSGKYSFFFLDKKLVVLCAQEELGEHTVHEVVVASPVTSFPGFPSFSESLRANADFSPQIFFFFPLYAIWEVYSRRASKILCIPPEVFFLENRHVDLFKPKIMSIRPLTSDGFSRVFWIWKSWSQNGKTNFS